MRLAIIGCGYVGLAAARLCRERGWQVTATTTRAERLPELAAVAERAEVLRGENAGAMAALLAEHEVVLLCVGAPSPLAYERTYVETARNLVAALALHPAVRQVVYTGSYSVYGDRRGAWVDESDPATPHHANGRILLQTEQLLLAARSPQRRICVLRLGGLYGPERELVDIFGWAAGQQLPGDGSDYSNWVHRDDVAAALVFAVEQQLDGLYNLVGDVPLTRRTLVEGVLAQHHLPPVRWDDQPPQAPQIYNARVANRKLRAAGYRLQYPRIPGFESA